MQPKYSVLNVKYADYTPDMVYRIEILSINGDQQELFQSVINPEAPIFDYGIPAEFGITAEDIQVAPSYPDLYEKISSNLSGQIIFHHTASSLIAMRALAERYGLEVPNATYINSEKIVRRIWPECFQKGYGLRSMQQLLNISSDLSPSETTNEILNQASTKAQIGIDGLIDIANRPYPHHHGASHLQTAEGNSDGPLFGETIVFTGSLDRPRSELRDMVVELGCTFADTLNKDTTILVVGNYNNPTVLTTGKSGKLTKAEKYNREGKANIEILSSDSFYRMLSEFITIDE